MTEFVEVSDVAGIADHYLDDARPARPDRPWITLGMISSLDGAATVDGGSTDLGGPPDRAVFQALRAVADVIFVGASTVRAEGYRSVRLPEELVAWRIARGMREVPAVAIVSNSLDLDLSDSLVASRPLVVTSERGRDRGGAVRDEVEMVVAGVERVDFPLAMAALRARGVERVILEGGPSVNGQTMDLLDEACVTIAPVLAGGDAPRIVEGGSGLRRMKMARIIACEGFLLLRYLVD
ncbi:MAG TPA: dihydrofolate reductase family protein [Acidimicrobiia bacterium]|nr:dihydrofolate reductase family protein [Acidimicrobiia bacterium]